MYNVESTALFQCSLSTKTFKKYFDYSLLWLDCSLAFKTIDLFVLLNIAALMWETLISY